MEKHICKTCGKAFKSKIALGGHRSSHGRVTAEERENFIIFVDCHFCSQQIKDDTRRENRRKYCNPQCRKDFAKRKNDNLLIYNVKQKHLIEYIENSAECEICGNKEKATTASKGSPRKKFNNLSRDHNHETGNFRGALCYSCNVKLGWYEKLSKEINEYLNKYNDFENVKKKMRL